MDDCRSNLLNAHCDSHYSECTIADEGVVEHFDAEATLDSGLQVAVVLQGRRAITRGLQRLGETLLDVVLGRLCRMY